MKRHSVLVSNRNFIWSLVIISSLSPLINLYILDNIGMAPILMYLNFIVMLLIVYLVDCNTNYNRKIDKNYTNHIGTYIVALGIFMPILLEVMTIAANVSKFGLDYPLPYEIKYESAIFVPLFALICYVAKFHNPWCPLPKFEYRLKNISNKNYGRVITAYPNLLIIGLNLIFSGLIFLVFLKLDYVSTNIIDFIDSHILLTILLFSASLLIIELYNIVKLRLYRIETIEQEKQLRSRIGSQILYLPIMLLIILQSHMYYEMGYFYKVSGNLILALILVYILFYRTCYSLIILNVEDK